MEQQFLDLFGVLAQQFAGLTPALWLQASAIILAAIIAVFGSWSATRSAYRHASKVIFEEAELQRSRDRALDHERLIGILHMLREDLVQLWSMIAEEIAQPIERLESSRPTLPYWGCYQTYFAVFDAHAPSFGAIENDQLRTVLVRTFFLAKRLVDQYQNYNRIKGKEGGEIDSKTMFSLHNNAFSFVGTYQSLKNSVEQLRNLLDAELGLRSTPWPMIDQPAETAQSDDHRQSREKPRAL